MPNIGAWEKSVAKNHGLHASWLVPSSYGEKCPCCKKLRRCDHYAADTAVCVFCYVACKEGNKCKQSPLFEKD